MNGIAEWNYTQMPQNSHATNETNGSNDNTVKCATCRRRSRTESITLCDFEDWGNNRKSILSARLKTISIKWNQGEIKKNKSYFNVTISREEYERLKRGE